MATSYEIFEKILSFISSRQVTLYQIVYNTRLNERTVKKYIRTIEMIQDCPKLKKEMKGSRVYFKLERASPR